MNELKELVRIIGVIEYARSRYDIELWFKNRAFSMESKKEIKNKLNKTTGKLISPSFSPSQTPEDELMNNSNTNLTINKVPIESIKIKM